MKLPFNSLKFKLTFWLLLCSVGFWCVAAIWIYHAAQRASFELHDSTLCSLVETLAQALHQDGVRPDLYPVLGIVPTLHVWHSDKRYYAIRDTHGELMPGSAPVEWPTVVSEQVELRDTRMLSKPVRMATKHVRAAGTQFYSDIAVAETIDGRMLVAREAARHLIGAWMVLLLLLCVTVVMVVYRTLLPLEKIRRHVLAAPLSNSALGALDTVHPPWEIQPLVAAINNLREYNHAEITRQRTFLSDAAHQLRTPLAGLKLQVELAQRDPRLSEAYEVLSHLQSGIDRTCLLVNKMLSLAATEPGLYKPEALSICDLCVIAHEVVTDFALPAFKNKIDIGCEPQMTSVHVRGHNWALRELLSNLVDNAIRYTPEQGSVTVELHRQSQELILAVDDTGPGIPESEHTRVFERFYRVPGVGGEGSGLGLVIVKEIASQHGATVHLGVGRSGKGTRVEVRFPYVDPPIPEITTV